MSLSALFNQFMFFSFAGWIYETIYTTTTSKHWQNRGFLFGPICPIYGIGVVVTNLIFHQLLPYLTGHSVNTPWKVFLICAIGSAILEYSVSWLLETFFHAMWWDYSNVPLNIKGRICLPATCGFGVAGVLFVRVIFPFMDANVPTLPALASQLIALLLAMLLGADIGVTVASLSTLIARLTAMQESFDTRMASNVERIQNAPDEFKERLASLSFVQKHQLVSISKFRNVKYTSVAVSLKEAVLAFKDKAIDAAETLAEKASATLSKEEDDKHES
ncbi:MAG: putative ABC transporter permease [Lachnospiraceae bacterium]|nr:putative ABC transporter permease [Lachnospiraceae bacterium]